jgi:hypothetical protein
MRCTALLSVFVLALARGASAQPAAPPSAPDPLPLPLAELEYHVGPGLACPVADELRAEVTKQMRYDPFAGGPGVPIGRFVVTIGRVPGSVLRVDFHLAGVGDTESVDTEFAQSPATARTCRHMVTRHVAGEIVSELTLAMMRLAREATARANARSGRAVAIPACSTPAPCPEYRWSVWPSEWPLPPLEKPKPDPPKPPERWPVAVRIASAAWWEVLASGWGSFGLSAETGVRYRALSASVELHGDPPLGSQTVHDVGTVSFARVSGAMVLCAHFGLFAGCGVGDAGGFIFPNHVQELPASTVYGAIGVRAGLELPVAPPRFFLRVTLDLRAPIHPASYTHRGDSAFEAAGPSGGLGLGGLFELAP